MDDRPTVLLPIRVLEGESIPDGVPKLLAHAHIVLLGYHVIPDQTAPGQAEMQFQERASTVLERYSELLSENGATVEDHLVFTHDKQKTIDRVINEHDADVVLVPNATVKIERILVAIRGLVGADRIAQVVAGLFAPMDVELTLFHLRSEETTEGDAATFMEGLSERIIELGVDEDVIDIQIETGGRPLDAIIEASADYDAVVMGESDPSLITFIFGMTAERVAEQFLAPVFVVQREKPAEPEEQG